MKRAVNPETGEVVFLVNNEWVSPTQTAVNEAGEKAYLLNNEWVIPPVPTAPTLSPEEQMMAPIGADTTGGVELSDYGKLFGAGAVKSTLGAPEAIQAGTSGIARDTATKPTEILDYLADPRKLANDLAQAVRLPKIFEDDAKVGIMPEKTMQKQKLAIDEALTKGKIQSFRDLTNYGSKIANRIEDSVTDEMKQALADSQPTGNIIEALETGDFSKISLGKDPSLAGVLGQASKVFGSTAPAILTSVVSKSPMVGGIAGFGQAGSEGVEAAREHIKSMNNDQLAEKSEYFRNLLALGYNPELARKMTEEKAADTAAYYQGMVGALGNQFTSNLIKGNLDDALLANVRSRLGKILKGGVVGMTEEGFQELAEGIATDLGIDKTVVREMGVDSFANVVLGAIGGGAPGAGRGAVSRGPEEQVPPAPPVVTPPAPPTGEIAPPTVTSVTVPPEVTPPAAPVPPAAPKSGAIAAEEIETAETPAKPSEVMMPVVDADGNVTDELDKVDLNNVFVEDGQVWVRGEEWDHDLMSVLEELKDEDLKMALVKRAEELMPKAPEAAIETPEVAEAPEVPEVEDDAVRLIKLQKRFSQAEESGALPTAQANQVYKLIEKEQIDKAEALLDKFLKAAEERKAKEAPKATEVLDEEEVKALPTAEDVDVDKNIDRIRELGERRNNDEELTDEEDALLDAAHRKIYTTAESIKSPPPKKGYASRNHIDVNQVGGKWVAGSSYMGKTGGYGLAVSYDSEPFDSREEAINAEIDKMRPYAMSQDDKATLKWLDSIDSRIKPTKALTKEEKAEANRKRQEEKKAKAAEEKAAAKKAEEESWAAEVKQKQEFEAAQRKKSAEEAERRKEVESLKLTKFEDDTGIPTRELKEVNELVDETEEEYGDALRNYIKTGKGKDLVEKAHAKHDAAIKEFNKTIREIRGEEEAEEAPKPEFKRVRTYKRGILTKAVDIYELAQSLENIGETEDKTISEFTDKEIVDEAKYILGTFNESGHANNDALIGEAGADAKKDAQQQVNKLKQLIKKYEVKEEVKAEEKPAADFDSYVDSVSDQIDRLVDYARVARRSAVTRDEVINKLRVAYKESPEKAQSALDGTEANMKETARRIAIDDLSPDYYEAVGKTTKKEDDLVRAIKSGILDISEQENADAIYKLFDIKKSDIKKAATGAGVPALIDKFSGSFFGKPKEVSEEVYDEAAKQFLEGDLKAKVPTGKMDTINPVRLKDVKPQPIEKSIKPIANTFADQVKALFQIAPKQEIRYYLTGIHVQDAKKRLVTTDGHRLAVINNASLKDAPKKTGDATIYTRDNKYIDGQFPDIDRVIPKEHAENKTTFDVKPLGDHARGANKAWRYISSKMAAPIQINLGDTKLSFNAKYIEDMSNIFRQMGYDTAEISMKDGRLYATSPDGKVQQVIMSMREDRPIFAPYAIERNMVISGEGLIREITPEDRKLLTNSTSELAEAEKAKLEKAYGAKRDTDAFLQKLREDATKYINEGAEAVDKAIRSIIAKVAAAILSVAIVFNPNYMSDASAVALPQVVTKTVTATVPTDAKGMSDSGKKAYAILYPALKQELQKNNKYFTVVDKPTSQMFVFNPDGSMLLKSNVLLGSQFGDTYVGQTDFKQNRMTAAGLIKAKAEKGSATYDGKTVYTFGNVQEGWNAVFMHSVYLKAGDAEARLKALETGKGTRLSYGCINGPEDVMNRLDNKSMDESHVFIVPDNQAATDAYIANQVSNEDLTRETVKPLTKKVPSQRAKTMTEEEVFGREEELPIEPRKSQAEINRDRQQAKKTAATGKDKGIFFGNFTGNLSEDEKMAMRREAREEKIIQKGVTTRKITTVTKKIAKVGSDIETQKALNYLLAKQADLSNEILATKEERRSADWFKATAQTELAKGNIMPETMAVIDELYKKYPSFLEGLKLSVRAGKRAGVEGAFDPFDRLVKIYKNPFSVTQDETMRHEIMHSLEQMMTPEAQIAVVKAWSFALSKAINKHKDERSQEFFNAVLDYVENPTRANYRKATNKMPDLSFYQYVNPSEFWAVNGEKLMKSQLGNSWARFVKGVQKILEALKNVFGFDNRYAVHREFDRLMKGESGQMTDKMLADYLKQNDEEIEFLNQVSDVDELLEKHDRPDAPLHPSDSLKDRLLHKTKSITELYDQYKRNPRLETSKMIGDVDRAITYARNKNVWFGTGLELADLKRYNGQLRDDKGFAVASIALTNAVHAGHVATQVVTHGGLRFDPVTQQFTAYDSKYSLANIVREKAKLIAKLGEQRASNLIQAFFEAKRSRSIQNEFYDRQAAYETLKQKFESAVETEEKDQLYKDMIEAEEDLRRVSVALDKVNMTDEAIDDFIAMENEYPELKAMMRNWTAVNQNMIDNLEFSGIISKKRAEVLRNIKDYVPWYRIQEDMADPHDPVSKGVRGLTNVGQEKKFKKGQTDLDIDDIVDNMIHNVMMTTRNSIRNYAANRIAQQYATRNDKGKIKVFPKEGTMSDGAVRVNILANGRRIVVEIKDPLIAEAVLGMESIEIPMLNALGVMANGLRRGITSFPIFQLKQLLMDAPTAAWVSGVKNPFKLWADTFASFVAALRPNDPIVKMMKSYGIGGYQSSARTPEKELKMQIGLIGKSPLAYMLKVLDHIGDASDYAQRRAVYKQVLKETGDEMQALLQANNVIDFLKHGSGRAAQATVKTVAFMNAYAQSMDVMAQAMAGGGLKGKERSKVFAQFVKTGMILATLSLLYSFAIGDDEEYQQMDDQTKARNFIIPKSMTKFIGMDKSIKIPMHTSASFFFKSVPELLYNKIMNEGTKNQMDNQRLRTALKEAAADALLGPNVTPTGIKPFIEIGLNKNFFTGGTLTPKGMENLEAFRQYTASTSELGKVISKGTFGLLNPIEADHLMRSLLGTAGAAAMWGSNLFSGDRPEPNASSNPFYGEFVSAPVPRGREDIYYDLKERSTKVHDTFIDMMKKGRTEEANKYRKENEELFKAYGYTNGVEQGLKQINAEIRRIGDLPAGKLTPEQKRERITYYQEKKNQILKDVIEYRKRAKL